MSQKHNWLWALAAVAILGAIYYRVQATRQPAMDPVGVTIVTGGSGPYWQLVEGGARDAADEFKIELTVLHPEAEENVQQQSDLLKKIDANAVDGVAVSPLDAKAQTPLIDEIAKGANVVTIDSDAPDSDRMSYIGTVNVQAGRLAADLVRQAVPEGGKVVLVYANLTKSNLQDRQAGFKERINAGQNGDNGNAPAYDVVAELIDEGDVDRCRELVAEAIANHEDLACIVGMNAKHGPVLAEVVKDQGKVGKIAIVAFDEQEGTLQGIEEDVIYGAVVQDPYRYGYDAVRLLAMYARGGANSLPLAGSYSTLGVAPGTVKKESLEEFRQELAKKLAASGAK